MAGLHLVSSADQSLLAKIGSIVAPLFAPLGFGDWRVSTALITGFMAKESVVSTLTVLLGGKTALLQTLFTPFTAYVFLIFTLLYTPCVAAIATVRREMGTVRAAAGIALMQCATAWIVAFVVHGVGMMLGYRKNILYMAFHILQKTFCGRCESHIFFMGNSNG